MALCDNCAFMDERYDTFRQNYNDAVPIDNTVEQHFCPMYDDHIPNGIYYGDSDCSFYNKRA
jgi:hypothetical protein